jgi:hypothetical protein
MDSRTISDVNRDCLLACYQCTGGTHTQGGRIACNLRDDKGKLAPIDCMIPRIAASVEVSPDSGPLVAIATTDFINAHIKDTSPFPPKGASDAAKKQAIAAAPVVAVVAEQSSGQPEAGTRVRRRK